LTENTKIANNANKEVKAQNIRLLTEETVKELDDFCRDYPTNPDDILDQTDYSQTGYDLYTEMYMDTRIHGIEQIIRRTLFSVPFQVGYNDKDPDEIVDFINDNFENIENDNFNNILKNLLDARVYGFKVAEKVFKNDGSKLRLSKIKVYPSSYFNFQTDGKHNLEYVILHQGDGKQEKFKRDEFLRKFVYFVYPYILDGNFYGQSVLKPLYPTWRAKKRLNIITPIAYELRSLPPVIAKYAQTLNGGKAAAENVSLNIKDNTSIQLPSRVGEKGELQPLIELSFLEGGFANYEDLRKQIDEYDKDISRGLGVPDDIGYTSTDTGSNAKARTQIEVFYDLIIQEQERLEDLVNKQIIKQLIEVNFGQQKEYPKFKFVRTNYNLLQLKIAILTELKAAGIKVKQDYIKEFIDMPIEDDVLEKPEIPDMKNNNISKEIEHDQDREAQIKEDNKEIQKQYHAENNVDFTHEKETYGKSEEKHARFEFQKGEYDTQVKIVNRPLDYVDYQAMETFYTKMNMGFIRRLARELNTARLNFVDQATKGKELSYKKQNVNDIAKYIYAIGARSFLEGIKSVREETFAAKVKIEKYQSLQTWEDIINDIEEQKTDIYLATGKVDNYAVEEIENVRSLINEYLKQGVKLSREQREALLRIKTFAESYTEKLTAEISNNLKVLNALQAPERMTQKKIVQELVDGINKEFEKYINPVPAEYDFFKQPLNAIETPMLQTIVRTNTSSYLNRGRYLEQTAPELTGVVTALQYSAILDDRTTYFCQEHDGEIIDIKDPRVEQIYPPNHYNCRSLMVSIFLDEQYNTDWGNKPQSRTDAQEAYSSPADGFGGVGRVTIPKVAK